MKKYVLIPTKLNAVAKTILEDSNRTVFFEQDTPLDEAVKSHPESEALIVRSEKVTKDIIDQLPNLKTIVRAGAGYDNIDCKYARSKGIDVMNTPGANANGVAEEAVGMMLAASRHFLPADSSTRQGLWEKKKFGGSEVTNKIIGIIGMGAIGQRVCKLLSGFNVKILGYDPFLSADKAKSLGVEMSSIEDIFSQADYISLHVPENDNTRGMVNKEILKNSKDGLVIINCARAAIVNEDDLREVKKEKTIRYCTDVYPKDIAGEKPVADIADIMLPHIGASTKESNYNAAKKAADQLNDLWDEGITRFVVNSIIPEGLDESYQKLAFKLTKLCRAWLGETAQIRQVETSFYGDLESFATWMVTPIVSALDNSFDSLSSSAEALSHLTEKGIDYVNRKADNAKKYGESITIDLFAGSDMLNRVSIRGTVTESELMIARISDFHKLYFSPDGHNIFFTYTDRPAVLGKITSILGKADINIHDIRAPHNRQKDKSLAIVKVDKEVSKQVIDEIKDAIEAETAFYINL